MTLFPWPYPKRKTRNPFSPSAWWAHVADTNVGEEWHLLVRRQDGRISIAAMAWGNGTWHTFDPSGVGGENDMEKSLKRAKVEAAASAVAQGFI